MIAKDLKILLSDIPDNTKIVVAKNTDPLYVVPIAQIEKEEICFSDWFVDEEEICLVVKTK